MICPTCHSEAGTAEMCSVCGRPMFLASGEVLSGRYEILSQLGSGGMGTVYRAHDRILDETVALKVLRLDLARSAAMARRFRSEIKLARKVSHRNVCRIYDYGEDGQHVYISMEFVDGVELHHKVRGRGLPAEEGFELAIQLTKGLQAVHDVGIIHRDLKSSNVMVDAKGLVRLMDFGIAKRWIADGQITGTMVGQIMGTPEYMSPEQARGHPVDFRGDIYSLGIVLFEIFTGHLPFEGRTKVETLFLQLEEPPPVTGPKAKRLPRALVPILKRTLAKDPNDRYASARGLTEALRLARGGPDLEPRVRPAFFHPRRKEPLKPTADGDGPAAHDGPAPAAKQAPPRQPEEPTSVLEQLLDELIVDPVEEVLVSQADPGLEQKVCDLAREVRNPDVRRRWRAAVALWEIGPAAAEAMESLTAALSDEAPIVANAAAQALARIRGDSAPRQDARPTTGVIDVPVLVEALRHHDVRVREWAAVALRDMGTAAQDAVPALIAVLKDPASGIRDWAALALGAVCTDVTEVLPELVRALNDNSMFLRAAAATSLGSLGARARPAVPDLMQALRDENGGVRGRAAVALGRMGGVARDAVPLLLRLLEDREVSVADAASLALEKIVGRPEPTAAFAAVRSERAEPSLEPPAAAPAEPATLPPPPPVPVQPAAPSPGEITPPEFALTPPELALTPPEPDATAAEPEPIALHELLAAMVSEPAAPATLPGREPAAATPLSAAANGSLARVRELIKALGDNDGNVRWRAAMALGQMGAVATAAVRPLIETMDDTEESVRWEAAKALGKIGPAAREAVPALAAALAEGDDVLRDAAATALGLMGTAAQNAVPALIRSLRSSVEGEPDAALETLVKLGRSSVPALIEALNEDDPVIRSRAAAALTRVAGAS